MNLVARWRRCRAAARSRKSSLREFIYLDDVSVYSLMASRRGGIATEFTESETASLQADVTASAGAGVGGILKSDVSTRLQAAQTQRSQVLRKAIVQTTFKELYELERESLRLRPITPTHEVPAVRDSDALIQLSREEVEPWVVPSEALRRGDLIEVEVELSAEPIFRMSAVISTLVGMMKESDELARTAATTGEIDQVAAVARIIERLLAGLIPIRAHAVDYEAVEAGGRDWVVNRAVARQGSIASSTQRRPLFAVGVAEEALFWKDIRRVLFSNSRYRMLCRLARDGTPAAWTPVKLADVLRDVAPDLASQLDSATEGLLTAALDSARGAGLPERGEGGPSDEGLLEYATSLAKHHGVQLSDDDLQSFGAASVDTYDDRLTAFRKVTDILETRSEAGIDREVAVQLRSKYLVDTETGRLDPSLIPPHATGGVRRDERYLDVEFVAIYW